MKLCKDCKYFSKPLQINIGDEPYCLHEKAELRDDPVWGNHSRQTCKTMRDRGATKGDSSLCGPLGKLWIAAANFTPTEYTHENT